MAGRTLADESRCQPSKCADTEYLGFDSCGGEALPVQTWADWQQLPDGCGHAAPASDSETTVIDVLPSPAPDASGCGLSASSSVGAWTSSLLGLAEPLRFLAAHSRDGEIFPQPITGRPVCLETAKALPARALGADTAPGRVPTTPARAGRSHGRQLR